MQKTVCFRVMVPIYKVEPYLDECIQSVLNQTYDNFELILLDDGSPDRCGEICEEYAKKDPRVTVYHKPNGGLMQTRRFGIEKAGKDGYAVFLDGDDSLRPHALQTIAEKIEKYHCDCVIFGAEQVLDGTPLFQLESVGVPEAFFTDKREFLVEVLNREMKSFCRKSVRMDLLTGWDFSPYYHLSKREDQLQSLEVYENAQSFCVIEDVLYNYRVNPGSITRTIKYSNYKTDYSIQEAEWEFVKRLNLFSPEDFAQYQGTCMEDLSKMMVGIADMRTSYKNKVGLYREIKETRYWKEFLSHGKTQQMKNRKLAVLFDAFSQDRFALILLFAWAYRMMRKMR